MYNEQAILKYVVPLQFSPRGLHGLAHWLRVKKNALKIANCNGADKELCILFALFHDCQRANEGQDPYHGPCAAKLVATLNNSDMFSISNSQMQTLVHAIKYHTEVLYDSDPTVGACWDADRMDLGRVGVVPDYRLLNTDYAKRFCINKYKEDYDLFGIEYTHYGE